MPYLLNIPTDHLVAFDYAPHLKQCKDCGAVLNLWGAGIELFEKPKARLPLSYTQDGCVLMVERFPYRVLTWNFWRAALKFKWLVNGCSLVQPKRVVKTTLGATADMACTSCHQPRTLMMPSELTLRFGEVPVGPRDIVRADFQVSHRTGRCDLWIVGNVIAEDLKRKPQGKLCVGPEVGQELWPTGEVSEQANDGDVVRFPRTKRPKPTRGSIRHPKMPDDL